MPTPRPDCPAIDIAFLAISQAHQALHWLPAALHLAHTPEVTVHVLSASRAMLDLIDRYDPSLVLERHYLPTPSLRRDGLFSPPSRLLVLLLHHRRIGRFATIVTTEATSAWLKKFPGFTARLVEIKHGAGDREGGYDPKFGRFDLMLVAGEKDRARLVERGLVAAERCIVAGYGKFDLIRPTERVFPNARALALYNPHFGKSVSSWFGHGAAILAAMERIGGWDFIVAPHVKLTGGPAIDSAAPNVIVDRGSIRSIDMSYVEQSDVYIGDASSQVYEFVRRPRPCIFLNLDRIAWRDDPHYAHWHLGQVIETVDDLGPALARADQLQPGYDAAQRAAIAWSMDRNDVPAAQRQAGIILDFARHAGRFAPSKGIRPR